MPELAEVWYASQRINKYCIEKLFYSVQKSEVSKVRFYLQLHVWASLMKVRCSVQRLLYRFLLSQSPQRPEERNCC
jgi:hypothetical protein